MAREENEKIKMFVLGVDFGKATGWQEHGEDSVGVYFYDPEFNADGFAITKEAADKWSAETGIKQQQLTGIGFDFQHGTVDIYWEVEASASYDIEDPDTVKEQREARIKLDYAKLHEIRNRTHPED